MLRLTLSCLMLVLPLIANCVESPAQLLAQKMGTALLKAKNQMTGEGVCWHAAYKAGAFVQGYHQTADTAYLEAAETYFDALIAQMYTSPDGYKGFVGPTINKNSKKIADCHVGDAILCAHFLSYAEIVLKDDPLKQQYGAKAQSYVDLVETHLIEKWQKRETWWQNGPFGGYITFDKYLTKENMNEFQMNGGPKGAIGYQFNKQLDMAVCHLRLYRITGNKDHREKAMRIYNHSKARLNLVDDHYVWNYWEPFYPRDIMSQSELVMWVATHPYRNYQSGEVHNFVEAFHSGLTFDQTDIKRLIQTNLHMWNGDLEKPRWKNSNDVAVQMATQKGKEFIPSKAYPTKAGCLWGHLCEFSPELATIAGKEASNTEFKRKYEDLPVTVFEVPFSSSANINMAIAMPAEVKSGAEQHLVSKCRKEGDVTISLCDADGKPIKELFTTAHAGGNDGREGLLITSWTADIDPGVYRIRWAYADEHRDYVIWITE